MQRKARAAKRNRRDYPYGTLEAFPEFFAAFTPPAGAFDPRGAWKLSYAVWLFGANPAPAGFLEIERRGTALKVATRIAHANGYEEQNATLECAPDAPGALRSLTLESVSGTLQGEPVPATRIPLRVDVRGDSVQFTHAGRKRAARAAPPVVSHWALPDVLQRLAPGASRTLEFTLLDDGDLLKPGQRLSYVGKTSVQAGSAPLTLDCWEQTGSGVLPAHYWLDAQHRLLFAVAGQRAYLYDPGARNRPLGRPGRRQA